MKHILLLLVTTIAFAATAHATPMTLTLSSGATSVTVTDGGVGDINGATGAITYMGTVDSFFLNVATGVSSPILGNANLAALDLHSLDISAPTGGTLTIRLSDGGLSVGAPSNLTPNSIATMGIGGTTEGTVTYNAYYNGGLIDSMGPIAGGIGGSFAGGSTTLLSTTDTFFLMEEVIISHTGAFSTSLNASLAVAPVPEPGTFVLVGAGLLGLAIYGKRRMKI